MGIEKEKPVNSLLDYLKGKRKDQRTDDVFFLLVYQWEMKSMK